MLVRIRGRLAILGLLVSCLILAWAQRAFIFRSAADLWIVHDAVGPADAVVVLGGGLDTRPFAAGNLYRRKLAERILIANTRRLPVDDGIPNDTDVTRTVLMKLGVPAEAIGEFGDGVSSTYEEARALAVWSAQVRPKNLIIPTESFSSRRVRWIMRHELGSLGVRVMIDTVSPRAYDVDHWWQHEPGVIEFQNEVLKYVYYRLKY